jgi:hypothetical protein
MREGIVTVTNEAPQVAEGIRSYASYPAPGTRLYKAWQRIWQTLNVLGPDEYVDATTLATDVGALYELAPTTLLAFLARARAAGLLEVHYQPVCTQVTGSDKREPFTSSRRRAHYRIAGGAK